jgi:Ulp1 family protease
LDNLQNRGKRKLGVVFNLDKHYQNGSHWVSMFVDLDKHTIFYYDSAVNPVPREVSRLKKEIIAQGKKLSPPINFDYIQNDHSHQTTNTECGMYCLFFIITWLTQRADKSIMDKSEHKMIGGRRVKISFEELIKMFTKPGINDKTMIRFRDIYFNKK